MVWPIIIVYLFGPHGPVDIRFCKQNICSADTIVGIEENKHANTTLVSRYQRRNRRNKHAKHTLFSRYHCRNRRKRTCNHNLLSRYNRRNRRTQTYTNTFVSRCNRRNRRKPRANFVPTLCRLCADFVPTFCLSVSVVSVVSVRVCPCLSCLSVIFNHLIDAAKQKAASIKCQDHNTIEYNII